MRAAGFEPEDFEADEFEVWPENWPAFVLFTRMQTQWQVGMAGCTGLRYEALYPLLDRKTQSPEEWAELFDDIQTLELAALEKMSEDRPTT